MPTFPQLISGGVTVQRPYQSAQAALTSYEDQPTGRRFARSWRTNPLNRWTLNYQHLTDSELETLRSFFEDMNGRYGEFIFLDPGGNLVEYSEDFTHPSWTKYLCTVDAPTEDPFGGSRAWSCTATDSNGVLDVSLAVGLPMGTHLCGSVWIRVPAPQSFSLFFASETGAILSNRTFSLAASWQRINLRHTVSTALTRFFIGGGASWGYTTIELFGAQAAPLPGPGAYMRSPANYGYHPKCRFDTDELPVRTLGPDQHSVTIPIVEYS